MDVETARSVKVGDVVLFEKQLREVLGIAEQGLWAPYFDLAEVGQVSHHLVELPGQRGKPKKVLTSA